MQIAERLRLLELHQIELQKKIAVLDAERQQLLQDILRYDGQVILLKQMQKEEEEAAKLYSNPKEQ
jgi:hypothetical protein